MRVVLVGKPKDRARLRTALASSSIEIVDEATTMPAGRAAGIDAYVVAAGAPEGTLPPGLTDSVEPLTPREIDVLSLLAEGLPNKAIAARLRISDQTVKFHVASICGKLGAINRTDAVRLAIQRGIVVI